MLDPHERCSVTECLDHVAFETERLLHRNHSSAVVRRSRKQSAARLVDVDSRTASRASTVVRCQTPNTPVPADKMELGSVSPLNHVGVPERHQGTPVLQSQEPVDGGTAHSSPDHAPFISDAEPSAPPSTEPFLFESTTLRFIRRKPATGSKPTKDETAIDQSDAAVEDAAQKERGLAQATPVAAAAKKTYCVNLSGAAVPAHHRSRKNPAQTSYIGTVAIKGSPLAERKTKVLTATYLLLTIHILT